MNGLSMTARYESLHCPRLLTFGMEGRRKCENTSVHNPKIRKHKAD